MTFNLGDKVLYEGRLAKIKSYSVVTSSYDIKLDDETEVITVQQDLLKPVCAKCGGSC